MRKSDCFKVHHAIHAGDSEVKLSDGDKVKIITNKTGTRECYAKGVRFMEQNRTKTSKWAKESRAGKRLTWILTNPKWGLLIDNDISIRCSFILDDDEEAPAPAEKADHKRKSSTLLAKEGSEKKKKANEDEDEDEEKTKVLDTRVYTLAVAFPSTWSTPLNQIQKIKLYPIDDDFNMISKLVTSTINPTPTSKLGRELVPKRILRIQNPDLWAHYQLRKKEIISNNQGKLVKLPNVPTKCLDETCNEFYLFHGLNEKIMDIITDSGFDERVSSLQGLFGGGIYFAENSTKSDNYAHTKTCGQVGAVYSSNQCTCQDDKERAMLVCRVLVGSPAIKLMPLSSDKPLRRPPDREDGPPGTYDSVIGEAKHHDPKAALSFREIIIYDRKQVYPEYVVFYSRKK